MADRSMETGARSGPPDRGADPGGAETRSFEVVLRELEDRVRKLDSGDLPLDDALRFFEEGVGLVRECQELLDGAERRIVELSETPEGVIQERTLS